MMEVYPLINMFFCYILLGQSRTLELHSILVDDVDEYPLIAVASKPGKYTSSCRRVSL